MTELEMIMADWVAIMLGLSDRFRMKSNGGGVINGSASEATLVSALLARQRALAQGHPIESMTAYLTPSRHASYDKAMGLSGITHIRLVKDSIELERAIVADLDKVWPLPDSFHRSSPPTCSRNFIPHI
uniref:Glutamate decarboxylase n=1 Tax=Spongospora subterranea TaxID=70186 RepID=A0A0H5R510_9EUKA|eukprot:CRZ03199.1 hypothetical protein [Spongospora subterranea]